MTIVEPSRQIPVKDEVDVMVCGGGPAGIAAAISAARAGAEVRLIESAGCLGGIWTAGLLPWVMDKDKPGLMEEINDLLRVKARPISVDTDWSAYEPEQTKHALEQLCLQAGVKVRLHTRVCAAAIEQRRIGAVLTESKSGREAWRAKVFIDTTGDGDLAAQAGCGFDYGRPGTDGEAQPMSLIALLGGLRLDEIREFIPIGPHQRRSYKSALANEMRAGGLDPSYAFPALFHVYDDLFVLMANHEYGVAGTDADDLTRATLQARHEIHRLVEALRGRGGPWKNIMLVATGEHIGVREGRRVHGRYLLTADDLVRGASFEDAVCRTAFPVDIHSTDPSKDKGGDSDGYVTKPYDIPLRSLIARDIDNLMMAGRCISGDFITHASYRQTGNAVAMGEAAGRVAAEACRVGRDVWEIDWPRLRSMAYASAGSR